MICRSLAAPSPTRRQSRSVASHPARYDCVRLRQIPARTHVRTEVASPESQQSGMPAHGVARRQARGAGRARSAMHVVDLLPGKDDHSCAIVSRNLLAAQFINARIPRSAARSAVHPEGDPARRRTQSDGCSDQRPPPNRSQPESVCSAPHPWAHSAVSHRHSRRRASAASGTLSIHCIIAPSRGPLDRQGICARTPRSTHG